ncbi:uncharacterized protein LOC135830679 isoform X2 [Sycon ciliatum]|uniref:uncharacterized protein LOC135830679 isoform X2 n=1 Tax=Sycon ciliatum TaxID=27933 RepID=UPI0031F71E1D
MAECMPLLVERVQRRLVYLKTRFANESHSIIDYLVENGIFETNSEIHQKLQHPMKTDIERFRAIWTYLPQTEKGLKLFMCAIEQTDTFKQNFKMYYEGLAKPLREYPDNTLEIHHWREQDAIPAWMEAMQQFERSGSQPITPQQASDAGGDHAIAEPVYTPTYASSASAELVSPSPDESGEKPVTPAPMATGSGADGGDGGGGVTPGRDGCVMYSSRFSGDGNAALRGGTLDTMQYSSQVSADGRAALGGGTLDTMQYSIDSPQYSTGGASVVSREEVGVGRYDSTDSPGPPIPATDAGLPRLPTEVDGTTTTPLEETEKDGKYNYVTDSPGPPIPATDAGLPQLPTEVDGTTTTPLEETEKDGACRESTSQSAQATTNADGSSDAAAAGGGGDGGGDDNGSEHSSSGPGTNWGSYLCTPVRCSVLALARGVPRRYEGHTKPFPAELVDTIAVSGDQVSCSS